MAEIRIPVSGHDLVFDSDDIENISTPADIRELVPSPAGWAWRELTGVYHLNITFRRGSRTLYEQGVV